MRTKRKDLLDLASVPTHEILQILDLARLCKTDTPPDNVKGKFAANLFFEPSTRTQCSFQVAEEKLGMRVVFFNPEASSMKKNETFYDTVKVFDSLGMDAIVIRHAVNRYYDELLGHVNAALLNAGDGTGNHPTQSLLDLLTIQEAFGRFEGLKVAIVGDVVHSRVAHTNFEVMRRLGMEVATSGPEEYMEESMPFVPFEEAVRNSDVLMLLRVQHERHKEDAGFSVERYHRQFGLTAQRVGQMKEKAIIMHPAPFNRGVEIAGDVVEGPKSRIFTQMQNGVFARMAALLWAQGEMENALAQAKRK